MKKMAKILAVALMAAAMVSMVSCKKKAGSSAGEVFDLNKLAEVMTPGTTWEFLLISGINGENDKQTSVIEVIEGESIDAPLIIWNGEYTNLAMLKYLLDCSIQDVERAVKSGAKINGDTEFHINAERNEISLNCDMSMNGISMSKNVMLRKK